MTRAKANKQNEEIQEQESSVEESEELALLRQRIQELEAEKAANADNDYMRELQAMKGKANAGLNTIPVKEIFDVKFVSLWHVSGHNIGKRVGPIHPAAAEDTFLMFRKAGIRLSTQQPTAEAIEKYKTTAEYKIAMEKERVRRAGKDKSKKSSEVDKLIAAMAKQQGILPEDVVKIKGKPAGVEV
jgi:hypothetical protein